MGNNTRITAIFMIDGKSYEVTNDVELKVNKDKTQVTLKRGDDIICLDVERM